MKFQNSKKFLQKFNNGDEKAFLKVYDFFAPKIFRFVYNKTGKDRDIAEDLTAHTFYKTWNYLVSDGKEIENIQAFLYRIARNVVIDHWRESGRHTTVSLEENMEVATETVTMWQEEFDKKLKLELIEKALSKIPEQYKEILLLRFMEGLEIPEIGIILDKDTNAVYVQVHRAIKKLKEVIQKEER